LIQWTRQILIMPCYYDINIKLHQYSLFKNCTFMNMSNNKIRHLRITILFRSCFLRQWISSSGFTVSFSHIYTERVVLVFFSSKMLQCLNTGSTWKYMLINSIWISIRICCELTGFHPQASSLSIIRWNTKLYRKLASSRLKKTNTVWVCLLKFHSTWFQR